MCEASGISRRSKNEPQKLSSNSNGPNHSLDVRFRRIIYRDARNWTWKLMANSNGHKFCLGYMLEAHDISRRLKMNNGSSQEIQIVITFITDVQFRCIIHRDARNWTRKLSINSNDQNFWLRRMHEAHYMSIHSKWTTKAIEKFKWWIHFTCLSSSGA